MGSYSQVRLMTAFVASRPPATYSLLLITAYAKPPRWMRKWRAVGEIGPTVRYWVVCPCVRLCALNEAGAITADDINLACSRDVTASREITHIRHGCPSAPGIRGDIINPSGIVSRVSAFPPPKT